MLKKTLGRVTKCSFFVVDLFPGKVRRENIWTQIGISACVLLLPPIFAIAVFAPHAPRPSDTRSAFEPLAQSPSTSLPFTEGSFWRPSRPPKLPGVGPTQFEDRFTAAFAYAEEISGQPHPIPKGQLALPPALPAPNYGNGIEARLPQTSSATEYRATTGESNATPGSSSVHQASSKSSADAALDVHDTKPLIERERPVYPASVHVSTCFPSASAVRQDHPEAWPSWTLRAPGHEGTRCWYAATRTNGPRSLR
jgi:hypothetical protein